MLFSPTLTISLLSLFSRVTLIAGLVLDIFPSFSRFFSSLLVSLFEVYLFYFFLPFVLLLFCYVGLWVAGLRFYDFSGLKIYIFFFLLLL